MKKILQEKKIKKQKLKKKNDTSISTDFCEEINSKEKTGLDLFIKNQKLQEEEFIFENNNFQSANFEYFNFENSDKKLFKKILDLFSKTKKSNLMQIENIDKIIFSDNSYFENSCLALRDQSLIEKSNIFFDEIMGLEKEKKTNKIDFNLKPFGFIEIKSYDGLKKFSFEKNPFFQSKKKFKFN